MHTEVDISGQTAAEITQYEQDQDGNNKLRMMINKRKNMR